MASAENLSPAAWPIEKRYTRLISNVGMIQNNAFLKNCIPYVCVWALKTIKFVIFVESSFLKTCHWCNPDCSLLCPLTFWFVFGRTLPKTNQREMPACLAIVRHALPIVPLGTHMPTSSQRAPEGISHASLSSQPPEPGIFSFFDQQLFLINFLSLS